MSVENLDLKYIFDKEATPHPTYTYHLTWEGKHLVTIVKSEYETEPRITYTTHLNVLHDLRMIELHAIDFALYADLKAHMDDDFPGCIPWFCITLERDKTMVWRLRE